MKSDTKKVISNILWMIFDKAFILIINLLVSVKIANYYGSTEYGFYQYVISIVMIMETVLTFVDGRVVKKRYTYIDPDELVYSATIGRIVLAIVTMIIGVTYMIFSKNNFCFNIMMIILLINTILSSLGFGIVNRFEYTLKSKKNVLASNISLIISSLLQLLAIMNDLPVLSLAVISLFSTLTYLIVIIVQYKKEFHNRKKISINKLLMKDIMKESIPLAIAASCATVYAKSDSIMLGTLMTTAEVGIYAVSTKLVSIVQIVLTPIRESVYPSLVRLYVEDKSEYKKKYIRITSILTWICIIGIIFSFWVLPWAFQFLNEEYCAAYSVYKVQVIGAFFMYNAALRAGHLTLIGRGRILVYAQVFSMVLNVILNYFCITYMGIVGAAVATAVTQGLSLFVSNLFFGKEGREIFIWQLVAFNPLRIFKKIK